MSSLFAQAALLNPCEDIPVCIAHAHGLAAHKQVKQAQFMGGQTGIWCFELGICLDVKGLYG